MHETWERMWGKIRGIYIFAMTYKYFQKFKISLLSHTGKSGDSMNTKIKCTQSYIDLKW